MRRTALAATMAFMFLSLAGCTGDPESDNRLPPTTPLGVLGGLPKPFGAGFNNVKAGDVISVGSLLICLDGSQEGPVSPPVTIDKVSLVRNYRGNPKHVDQSDVVKGIAVTAFATRSSPFTNGQDALGDSRTPLAQAGFRGDHVVTTPCNPGDGSAEELGLQLEATVEGRSGDRTVVRSQAVRIGYHQGKAVATLTIPMAVTFCPTTIARDPDCALDLATS